jgi:hypothetical protein
MSQSQEVRRLRTGSANQESGEQPVSVNITGNVNINSSYSGMSVYFPGQSVIDDGLLTVKGTFDNETGSVLYLGNVETQQSPESTTSELNLSHPLKNDGTIMLEDDDQKFDVPITGTGKIDVDFGSKLEFDSSVSTGQTIEFDDSYVEKLILDHPSSFHGVINGSVDGDYVDAKGFAFSDTTFLFNQSGDTAILTLDDGKNTATITFGNAIYEKSDFSIVSANGGTGSEIKYVG